MSDKKHLLTATEAAEVLRLTARQVTRLANRGEIPTVELPGSEVRFDERDLWTWIDGKRKPCTHESSTLVRGTAT
jgi:excisionase family DNA binding protein